MNKKFVRVAKRLLTASQAISPSANVLALTSQQTKESMWNNGTMIASVAIASTPYKTRLNYSGNVSLKETINS